MYTKYLISLKNYLVEVFISAQETPPSSGPPHISPVIPKHTHGHFGKTIAGNPCASRTHLQDSPPRKLIPRHQLPLSLAGLLASLQPTDWIQFTASFSQKQTETHLSTYWRCYFLPLFIIKHSYFFISLSSTMKESANISNAVLRSSGWSHLLCHPFQCRQFLCRCFQLKLFWTPLQIFQGFLVCRFKPSPSCYF